MFSDPLRLCNFCNLNVQSYFILSLSVMFYFFLEYLYLSLKTAQRTVFQVKIYSLKTRDKNKKKEINVKSESPMVNFQSCFGIKHCNL